MLNDVGRVLAAVILAVIIALIVVFLASGAEGRPLEKAPAVWDGQELVTGEHVEDYILRFLSGICNKRKDGPGREACIASTRKQKRARRAPELGEMIDRLADERGVDPLLGAVVVKNESSFYEKIKDGKLGEQGLMQVHGEVLRRALKKGYDLSTSEGQLSAGLDELARCEAEECDGSLVGTLSCYQAGRCKTKAFGPKQRARVVVRERKRVTLPLVAKVELRGRRAFPLLANSSW